MLPPLFPSQIHLQPEMKIPILQAHQPSHAHNQLLAHAQNHHPQEVHISASSAMPGSGHEQYISVASTHSTHLPHVSNLSRHINTR